MAKRFSRERKSFYQRDLPTEEDALEWVLDRKYSTSRLKELWHAEGRLNEAMAWIEKMTAIHGIQAKRWIWKVAEEEFAPQDYLDEIEEDYESVREEVEELVNPKPPSHDKIQIAPKPLDLSITEQLMWVNDHLYDDREELVAPCKAAAAQWEFYSNPKNTHRLYALLGQRVVPKEDRPEDGKGSRKAADSELVKDLDKMLREAAKKAKGKK